MSSSTPQAHEASSGAEPGPEPRTELRPVAGGERLVHLDVLRGFALFGILLVNIEWFNRPVQTMLLGPDPTLAGADRVVDTAVAVLAEGKFYALFSILFGAGFALMMERAEAAGRPFRATYLRRTFGLLAIGAAHMLLVWSGDILLTYAAVAFIMLLLFSRTPPRRLLAWALGLIAVPPVILGGLAASFWLASLDPATYGELIVEIEADHDAWVEHLEVVAAIHAEGGYWQNVAQRWEDASVLFSLVIYWVPSVLGYFLLGRWLLAAGWLRAPAENAAALRTWAMAGLLVGLPLSALGVHLFYRSDLMIPTGSMALGYAFMAAGSLVMALGYLAIVLLCASRLRLLAPAGRMALTLYLMQSLFFTWLIYGHGAGLWGAFDRSVQPLLVVAFFAAQVAFSHLWLARFRFGPAEWVWRSATYLRLPPLRR